MKILFVIPPYRTTDRLVAQLFPMPYATVLLGTILKQKGHQVEIKDFLIPKQEHKCKQPECFKGKNPPPYIHYGVEINKCKDWLRENANRFDAIGLCACQCNIFETVSILGKYIKKELNKPLVIGGPFATTAPEEAQKRTNADVVVIGEAENIVEEAFQKAIASWKGTVKGDIVDIEKNPLLDWSLANPENYPLYNNKIRCVLTISRGCPFACEFCSVHTIMSRKYRRLSKERILAEIRNVIKFGARYICFLDDNLFISEQKTIELLSIINKIRKEHKQKLKFYVEEGVEVRVAAAPNLIKKIADAGFDNIGLGVETLNEKTLEEVKKPYQMEQLKKAVQNCKDAGVVARAFYIIGFPNDTYRSVLENIAAFSKMGMKVRANNLKLYPNTTTTKKYLEQGLINSTYDWRLSSFYTPTSSYITYKEIRKLKTLLNAVGFATEKFGIDVFNNDILEIKRKIEEKGYSFEIREHEIVFSGGMYRPTPYKYIGIIVMLRAGCDGVKAVVGKNRIVFRTLALPRDELQNELLMFFANKERKVEGERQTILG